MVESFDLHGVFHQTQLVEYAANGSYRDTSDLRQIQVDCTLVHHEEDLSWVPSEAYLAYPVHLLWLELVIEPAEPRIPVEPSRRVRASCGGCGIVVNEDMTFSQLFFPDILWQSRLRVRMSMSSLRDLCV